MCVVADRIGALAWFTHQFQCAWNELPRDRVLGIVGVDQRGDVRRYRNRVARSDPFEIGERLGRRQAAGDQFGRLPQRRSQFWIDLVHASPAGGVHIT